MDDPTCRPAEELPNSTLFRFSTAGRKVVITERRFFRLCLAGAALPILGFLVTPRYSAVFLEYIFNFVPAFSDHGWASIYDGFLVGDPRGRPVANFFGYITFIARQWLLGIGPIPPTVSCLPLAFVAVAAECNAKMLSVVRPFDPAPDTPLALIDFAQLTHPNVPAFRAPPYRIERDL